MREGGTENSGVTTGQTGRGPGVRGATAVERSRNTPLLPARPTPAPPRLRVPSPPFPQEVAREMCLTEGLRFSLDRLAGISWLPASANSGLVNSAGHGTVTMTRNGVGSVLIDRREFPLRLDVQSGSPQHRRANKWGNLRLRPLSHCPFTGSSLAPLAAPLKTIPSGHSGSHG